MKTIDCRSDTVTKPTPGMLEAMMNAAVGDDVFEEDPSVNALEEKAARLFGMEAALFCASGTMSNQVGIKVHTRPGDEVICDESAHIYQYEGGGIAFNSGASVKLLHGDRGRISAAQVEAAINPDEVYKASTSLVSLENTSNRGGGSCYEMEEIKKIREVCDRHQLKLHLDGARLFNALVAKNQSAPQYGSLFHSISICLNKGLGCPVGSILLGTKDYIKKARRVRKTMGGGMRQAGYLAAAGIYALDNHVERLKEDHQHARMVASALEKKSFVEKILPVETNILIFEVKNPTEICEIFKEHDVLSIPMSETTVRMIFHLDITKEMVQRMIDVIKKLP